jgi:hypothetical protein
VSTEDTMTANDCNTQSPEVTQSRPPFDPDKLPDLRANVATAQAAGDLAYAQAEAAGMPNADRADAYHMAYTDAMRAAGTPMPCACDYCHGVSGWLMVPVTVSRIPAEVE